MPRRFLSVPNLYFQTDTSPISGLPFTIGTWVYFPVEFFDGSSKSHILWIGDKDNGGRWYSINTFSGLGDIRATHRFGGQSSGLLTGVLTLNEWVWVTATFVATNDRSIWAKGQTNQNTASRSAIATDRITLGFSGSASPVNSFDGLLRDVSIWDVALNPNEIHALEGGADPTNIRPQRLTHLWRLDESNGPARDSIGGLDIPENTVVNAGNNLFAPPPLIKQDILFEPFGGFDVVAAQLHSRMLLTGVGV